MESELATTHLDSALLKTQYKHNQLEIRAIRDGQVDQETRGFTSNAGMRKWDDKSEMRKQKIYNKNKMLAERTGLEPATPGVTGRYSNQLNYRSNR